MNLKRIIGWSALLFSISIDSVPMALAGIALVYISYGDGK